MGTDATVPCSYKDDFMRPQNPVDKVNPNDWFSGGDIRNMSDRMHGWVKSPAKYGR
jgi:hypothetical protein